MLELCPKASLRTSFDSCKLLNLYNEWFHEQRYYMAFLQNDEATMQQQAEWARGRPEDAAPMLLAESETAAYRGELSKARDLVRMAEEQAKEAQNVDLVASIMMQAATREAEFGNREVARKQATDALALKAGRDQMISAAMAFARTGDLAGAQKLADKLNQGFPLDTIVQTYWLP